MHQLGYVCAHAGDAAAAGAPLVDAQPALAGQLLQGRRAAGLVLLDAEDATLTSEELEEKYSPTGGGEHPLFKREDWRTAVNSDDTLLGYWGWVVNQLNQE